MGKKWRTCRLCMKEKLMHEVVDQQMYSKIKECLQVEIDPGDVNLPISVCLRCKKMVRKFYAFRKECWRVQTTLISKLRHRDFIEIVNVTDVNLSVFKDIAAEYVPSRSRIFRPVIKKEMVIEIQEVKSGPPSTTATANSKSNDVQNVTLVRLPKKAQVAPVETTYRPEVVKQEILIKNTPAPRPQLELEKASVSEVVDHQAPPGIIKLEALAPDAKELGEKKPEAVEPDATETGVIKPDALEPVVIKPESIESLDVIVLDVAIEPVALREHDAVEPDCIAPDAIEPDGIEPDGIEPEGIEPDDLEAEILELEDSEAETLEPEKPLITLKIERTEPEHFKAEALDPESSEAEESNADISEPEELDAEISELEELDADISEPEDRLEEISEPEDAIIVASESTLHMKPHDYTTKLASSYATISPPKPRPRTRRRTTQISGKALYKSLLMSCDTCGKMIERNRLEGHRNKHIGVRPYSCPTEGCNASFHCKHARRLHVRCRHGTESFTCDVCDKVYRARRDLLGHKREAHTEPKFDCDICEKKFTTRSRLKQHRNYHTGERNHPCGFCTMTFFNNFQLKVHMRTHTQARPFVCKVCTKEFRYRHMAKDHIVRQHGISEALEKDWITHYPEPEVSDLLDLVKSFQ